MLLENVAENFKVSVRCFGFVIDINLGSGDQAVPLPPPPNVLPGYLGYFH